MANINDRFPINVPGPYYVDHTCIDCDLCRNIAPEFFKRNDEGGHTFVVKQPTIPEEIELAEEGRTSCPTDSIGNDGLSQMMGA